MIWTWTPIFENPDGGPWIWSVNPPSPESPRNGVPSGSGGENDAVRPDDADEAQEGSGGMT